MSPPRGADVFLKSCFFPFRLSPDTFTALSYIATSMSKILDRFFNKEGHFYRPDFLDEADEETMVLVLKSVANIPRAERLVIKGVVKTGLASGVKVPASHLVSGDPDIMGLQITQMLLRTVTYKARKLELQEYVYQVNISVNLLSLTGVFRFSLIWRSLSRLKTWSPRSSASPAPGTTAPPGSVSTSTPRRDARSPKLAVTAALRWRPWSTYVIAPCRMASTAPDLTPTWTTPT